MQFTFPILEDHIATGCPEKIIPFEIKPFFEFEACTEQEQSYLLRSRFSIHPVFDASVGSA